MPIKREKFLDLFDERPDGSLSPKKAIEINGVVFTPGAAFQKGVVYGGIDFHHFKYRDIAIEVKENEEGPLKIAGFYED
jgi:hypothetical protein